MKSSVGGARLSSRVAAIVAALALSPAVHAQERQGTVTDSVSGKPISGATITAGDTTARTDSEGRFKIESGGKPVLVRATGYRRDTTPVEGDAQILKLVPLAPKALYLTVYGIGAPFLRDPALEVIEKSKLNALVIDVKGDRGLIPYPSAVPMAAKIGALKVRTVPDLKEMVSGLKAKGVYLIARIVTFKDDLLANANPQWAVRNAGKGIWKDREGLSWLDPFQKEAWNYPISIAEEAAAAGFDEIQFDYIRFPDAVGLVFSQPTTEESRIGAIIGFLQEARRRLVPYNVFLAMDSFGYICWNQNDTGIGQRPEELSKVIDVMSPMLYPSGFQFGIPGYRNPVQNSYEIVYRSLEECKKRTADSPMAYRPWLQAFTDYAFGGVAFGADQISKQVKAARDAGTDGWMLWNPRNVYSTNDIKPEP
jgi:hypothetical protein